MNASRGVCSLSEGGHVCLRWLTVLTGVFFLVMSFLRISNLFRSDLSLMSLSCNLDFFSLDNHCIVAPPLGNVINGMSSTTRPPKRWRT